MTVYGIVNLMTNKFLMDKAVHWPALFETVDLAMERRRKLSAPEFWSVVPIPVNGPQADTE